MSVLRRSMVVIEILKPGTRARAPPRLRRPAGMVAPLTRHGQPQLDVEVPPLRRSDRRASKPSESRPAAPLTPQPHPSLQQISSTAVPPQIAAERMQSAHPCIVSASAGQITRGRYGFREDNLLRIADNPFLMAGDSHAIAGSKMGRVRRDSHTRAESDHSGSQPAASNMLAHSSGVNCGNASRIASQSVGMVRAAAFRRIAFSLANAFSMGLKSGE